MIPRTLRTELGVDRLEISSTRQAAALTEIETQFRAEDETRNMMHLYDLRQIALLWEKVFGQRFPTDANYFPDIGKK